MKLWQQISMGSGVVLAVVCLASTSLAAGNGKGKQQGGGTGICPVTGTAAQPLRDGSCGGVAGGQGTGDRLRLRDGSCTGTGTATGTGAGDRLRKRDGSCLTP